MRLNGLTGRPSFLVAVPIPKHIIPDSLTLQFLLNDVTNLDRLKYRYKWLSLYYGPHVCDLYVSLSLLKQ